MLSWVSFGTATLLGKNCPFVAVSQFDGTCKAGMSRVHLILSAKSGRRYQSTGFGFDCQII